MEFNIKCPRDIVEGLRKIDSIDSGWKIKRELLKPDNYVWDEEWSVRQNREYTVQYNSTIIDSAAASDALRFEARVMLEESIADYIASEYDVSKEVGKVVWKWCNQQYASDAPFMIDMLMDFVEKVTAVC